MTTEECVICGRDTRAGLRYFVGRRRLDGPHGEVGFVCRVCRDDGLSLPSGAGRDSVEISMPAPHGHPLTH